MGSLLSKIKADAQKAGGARDSLFYVKDGEKKRIRFLQDMEEGWEIEFHDSYELNVNIPCQKVFGRDCQYCGEEELRTRSLYAWSVWDYDAAKVKIFMYAMNNCTPLATIAAMYETFGTLTDRDYVISRSGKQQNTQYTAIPMDKAKFRNEKAKPFSKAAFLKKLDEAYPDEHASKSAKAKTNYGDDTEGQDYSEMSSKELYKLCEDRGIEAEPKMKAKYYIDLLTEYDENDSDEWEDEVEDQEDKYAGKSAKELYKLCQERDIECEPKKPEKYYINLLKEDDSAHEDWEDEDVMNPPEDADEDEDW